MKLADFVAGQPPLVLEEYFAGHTKAYGLFEDRFGRVRRQFSVAITGRWDGRVLILEETFQYDDGKTDQRTWTIEKLGVGRYSGRADDVVGTAAGHSAGNALNWRYRMDLPVGAGVWRVAFDDWMFLQNDSVLINRARVSKWGITLGQVTLFFVRPGERPDGI